MVIPEHLIQGFLRTVLAYFRTNFQAGEAGSMLEALFKLDSRGNPAKFDTVDIYAQAKNLLTRSDEHQRKVEVSIGYNRERSNVPHIHILLPREGHGRYDAIGLSAGNETFTTNAGTQTETQTKSRSYAASYQLIVTGDNTIEIMIVYHAIKAAFVWFSEHLEFIGLKNLKCGGQDVQLADDVAPNVFHRALNIDFDYANEFKVKWTRDMALDFALLLCTNVDIDFEKAFGEKPAGTAIKPTP